MTDYRCYFFGTDNRIVDRADFTADTDALAIIEARALYAEGESSERVRALGTNTPCPLPGRFARSKLVLSAARFARRWTDCRAEFGKPHAEAQSRAPPRN